MGSVSVSYGFNPSGLGVLDGVGALENILVERYIPLYQKHVDNTPVLPHALNNPNQLAYLQGWIGNFVAGGQSIATSHPLAANIRECAYQFMVRNGLNRGSVKFIIPNLKRFVSDYTLGHHACIECRGPCNNEKLEDYLRWWSDLKEQRRNGIHDVPDQNLAVGALVANRCRQLLNIDADVRLALFTADMQVINRDPIEDHDIICHSLVMDCRHKSNAVFSFMSLCSEGPEFFSRLMFYAGARTGYIFTFAPDHLVTFSNYQGVCYTIQDTEQTNPGSRSKNVMRQATAEYLVGMHSQKYRAPTDELRFKLLTDAADKRYTVSYHDASGKPDSGAGYTHPLRQTLHWLLYSGLKLSRNKPKTHPNAATDVAVNGKTAAPPANIDNNPFQGPMVIIYLTISALRFFIKWYAGAKGQVIINSLSSISLTNLLVKIIITAQDKSRMPNRTKFMLFASVASFVVEWANLSATRVYTVIMVLVLMSANWILRDKIDTPKGDDNIMEVHEDYTRCLEVYTPDSNNEVYSWRVMYDIDGFRVFAVKRQRDTSEHITTLVRMPGGNSYVKPAHLRKDWWLQCNYSPTTTISSILNQAKAAAAEEKEKTISALINGMMHKISIDGLTVFGGVELTTTEVNSMVYSIMLAVAVSEIRSAQEADHRCEATDFIMMPHQRLSISYMLNKLIRMFKNRYNALMATITDDASAAYYSDIVAAFPDHVLFYTELGPSSPFSSNIGLEPVPKEMDADLKESFAMVVNPGIRPTFGGEWKQAPAGNLCGLAVIYFIYGARGFSTINVRPALDAMAEAWQEAGVSAHQIITICAHVGITVGIIRHRAAEDGDLPVVFSHNPEAIEFLITVVERPDPHWAVNRIDRAIFDDAELNFRELNFDAYNPVAHGASPYWYIWLPDYRKNMDTQDGRFQLVHSKALKAMARIKPYFNNRCTLTLGVPGAGKTFNIYTTHRENHNLIILAVNNAHREFMQNKFQHAKVFTPAVFVNRVARLKGKYSLLIDEIFLQHPAMVFWAVHCREWVSVDATGDRNQLEYHGVHDGPRRFLAAADAALSNVTTINLRESHTMPEDIRTLYSKLFKTFCTTTSKVLHSVFVDNHFQEKATQSIFANAMNKDSFAVICATQTDARYAADYGWTNILTIKASQGMRFDYVFLFITKESEAMLRTPNFLAVALTRHTKRIIIADPDGLLKRYHICSSGLTSKTFEAFSHLGRRQIRALSSIVKVPRLTDASPIATVVYNTSYDACPSGSTDRVLGVDVRGAIVLKKNHQIVIEKATGAGGASAVLTATGMPSAVAASDKPLSIKEVYADALFPVVPSDPWFCAYLLDQLMLDVHLKNGGDTKPLPDSHTIKAMPLIYDMKVGKGDYDTKLDVAAITKLKNPDQRAISRETFGKLSNYAFAFKYTTSYYIETLKTMAARYRASVASHPDNVKAAIYLHERFILVTGMRNIVESISMSDYMTGTFERMLEKKSLTEHNLPMHVLEGFFRKTMSFVIKTQYKVVLDKDLDAIFTKRGQGVATWHKSWNVAMSSVMRFAEQQLRANLPANFVLLNDSPECELNVTHMKYGNINATHVVNDFKEFDSSQNFTCFLALILTYAKLLGPGFAHLIIVHARLCGEWKLGDRFVRVKGTRKFSQAQKMRIEALLRAAGLPDWTAKCTYKVWKRMSGAIDTYFGNTLLNMILTFGVYDFKNIYYAAFKGDDSVVTCDGANPAAEAALYKNDITIKDKYGEMHGYFMAVQCFFTKDRVYPDFIRYSAKLMSREFQQRTDGYVSSVKEYQLAVKDRVKVFTSEREMNEAAAHAAHYYGVPFKVARTILDQFLAFAYTDTKNVIKQFTTFNKPGVMMLQSDINFTGK